MRTRICEGCSTVYHDRISCPECGRVPETERPDYEPPEPCDPWRVSLDFGGASLNMTVRNADQRRFVHEVIRKYGGGPTNGQ